MTILAKVAAPLVWLLDISGRAVLWLLGQRGETEEKVTDEEIKMLVAEAEHHGTIESDERAHDRRRHAARRPRRARRDDAAHRGRLAQPRLTTQAICARC